MCPPCAGGSGGTDAKLGRETRQRPQPGSLGGGKRCTRYKILGHACLAVLGTRRRRRDARRQAPGVDEGRAGRSSERERVGGWHRASRRMDCTKCVSPSWLSTWRWCDMGGGNGMPWDGMGRRRSKAGGSSEGWAEMRGRVGWHGGNRTQAAGRTTGTSGTHDAGRRTQAERDEKPEWTSRCGDRVKWVRAGRLPCWMHGEVPSSLIRPGPTTGWVLIRRWRRDACMGRLAGLDLEPTPDCTEKPPLTATITAAGSKGHPQQHGARAWQPDKPEQHWRLCPGRRSVQSPR